MSARTTAAIVIVIAFLAGLFVGAAGDRAWLFNRHRLIPSERGSHDFVRRTIDRLDRELNLTPSQHDRIAAILQQRRQQIDAIMAGVRPQIRQQIDSTDAEISKILTPEQRPRFEALRARMSKRHEHRRPH